MGKSELFGKDLICSQDWSKNELDKILELAKRMKKDRFSEKYTKLLKDRTFFMFFYNPSVRTRQSFECAATELGGHAQFLEPKTMRLKTAKTAGEPPRSQGDYGDDYGRQALNVNESRIRRKIWASLNFLEKI